MWSSSEVGGQDVARGKEKEKAPPVKVARIPLAKANVQSVQQKQHIQPEITVFPPAVSIPEAASSAVDERAVQQEVVEIGTLLDLLPCSPDSESDSDYVSDCEFNQLKPAVNSPTTETFDHKIKPRLKRWRGKYSAIMYPVTNMENVESNDYE